MLVNYLFYPLTLAFALGHLARMSFFGQQVNGYFYELIAGLMLAILFFLYRTKPLVSGYQKFRYFFWFLAFSFISYFVFLNKYSVLENAVGFLYQLRLSFYFIFFIYLDYHLKDDRSAKAALRKSIYLFSFLTAVIAIGQYFLYPDLRNLIYGGWDPHLFRFFGTFLDTYVAAALYGLIFIYFLMKKKYRPDYFLMPVFLILVIGAFSRIAYIALTASLLLVFFRQKSFKVLLLLVTSLLILFFMPKPQGEGVNLSRLFSIRSRYEDYKLGSKIFAGSPIIGVGYNRLRYVKKQLNLIDAGNLLLTHSGASLHSSFLIILATTGIIGLSLFVFAIKDLVLVSEGSFIYFYYVAVISLADNALLHPFIIFLLIILTLSRK